MDWQAWYGGLLREHARRLASEVPIDERLTRARRFIADHHHEALDLDAIARRACLSRFHFQREFKRTFDETPHQYLTRVRIDRARELLETSDQSVTNICLEVGFQSLGSFSSLFRKRVGHAPARYRASWVQVVDTLQPPSAVVPACFLMHFAPGEPL